MQEDEEKQEAASSLRKASQEEIRSKEGEEEEIHAEQGQQVAMAGPHASLPTDRRTMSLPSLLLCTCCALAGLLAYAHASALAATDNAYLSQFNGATTAAKSFEPDGLAVNSSSDVYVADVEHKAVDEFNASGSALLAEFTGSQTKAKAFESIGIAVNSSGDLYVADIGSHKEGEEEEEEDAVVDEFNPTGTAVLAEISGSATKAKSFVPIGVAVNASGDVYVADVEHKVVDEFNATGTAVLAEIKGGKTAAGSFIPTAVAVNASGDVYIVDNEHRVVDEFNAAGTGKPLEELTGSETPQGSFTPYKVAVAASGEVYVSDAGGVVDRFSSTGGYLSQFEGGATPQGSFDEPTGLAVGPGGDVYVGDDAHKVVDVFSEPVSVPAVTTGAATEVQETTATLTGSIDPSGGPEATCEFRYGTTTAYGSIAPCVPAGPFSSLTAVTAELTGLAPATTYHYRLEGTTADGTTPGTDEKLTTSAHHGLAPTATIKPVTAITSTSAIFNGDVNPNGTATEYHFEYSPNGTSWTSLSAASAGDGTTEVPVTQSVTGLTASTTYHVRLAATNTFAESAVSTEVTFPTAAPPPSAPNVFDTAATQVTSATARLSAVVYPEGEATTYQFQYGTSTSYGSSAPAAPGEPFTGPQSVSQRLTGLLPGTVYHFRIVATNVSGATPSADQTFTTLAAGEGEPVPPGACPNEALRAESNPDPQIGTPYSLQLPDCRAYEQVTPPFKSFNAVIPGSEGSPGPGYVEGEYVVVNNLVAGSAATYALSRSGSQLLEFSLPILGAAGSDGEQNPTSYALARGSAGWTTSSLTPEASLFPFARAELASPLDITAGLWAALTPTDSVNAGSLYRREADGSFTEVGPIGPASATAGPPQGAESLGGGGVSPLLVGVVGSSADLSHVVFQINSPGGTETSHLWTGDGTVAERRSSLYEYVGTGHTGQGSDVPALVGLDNTGQQISECGTSLGADATSGQNVENDSPSTTQVGVSASGSTVFFTAQAGGCATGATGPASNQLYARIGTPGLAQATVNVAGSSECATSTSCNLTSPVVYQGSSKDGSKVFFTTTQPLVESDVDTTNDIYECELPGDAGATPAPSGVVNACPDLKAVSVTGTSSGANVQSVVAVSEEGSRVYFIATGVLTSTPNDHARTAEAGKDNLYVWEAPSAGHPAGRTAFIATLPEPSLKDAQATPDGRYLVFTTTADVTADDTSTVFQAFRYDSQTGELVRVSVGENGYNEDGNTDLYPAVLASAKLGRVTVSEDGSYIVFQSSDALTPQVNGGKHNVYEWHDGNVYLISDGSDTQQRAGLIGMDATGTNIFFTTADQLVGQDTDEDIDIYDARIDGGFPAPTPEAGCGASEGCPGPLSASLTPPSIGSRSLPALGNAPPPPTQTSATTAKPDITKHSVKGATVTLTVKVPGKGSITVSGSGLESISKSVTDVDAYTVKVTLTAKERKLLKHRKLKLKLNVEFRPSTGVASSTTLTVTLKRA
jgi:sugar lactone lactonase YvrE